jgi:hypothetical protein
MQKLVSQLNNSHARLRHESTTEQTRPPRWTTRDSHQTRKTIRRRSARRGIFLKDKTCVDAWTTIHIQSPINAALIPIQNQHVVKIVPTSTNFNSELASSPAFGQNDKNLFQRHKKPHTQPQSLEQITATLQREQLLNLILDDTTMTNNNELKEVYALPIKQRNC